MVDRSLQLIGLTAASLSVWLLPKFAKMPPAWRAAFGGCGVAIALTAAYRSSLSEEENGFTRAEKMAVKERHATELAYSQMAFEAELQKRLGIVQPQAQLPPTQNVYLNMDANGHANGHANEQVTLPTEDLAQTIADSGSDEQNFLFVGKTRSGKTSLLVNAIAHKNQRHQGLVDWFIFNGKPEKDNDWGGLSRSPSDYWAVNSEDKAVEMFGQFQACVGALQTWQSKGEEHYPMVLVMDEVNNQRILMTDNDRKQFDKKIGLYATQCMSEQSGLWISTHSHAVDDIGLNKRLQQNFQVIVLGRQGKYESIGYAIDDEYLIRSKELRQTLKAQLQAYVASGEKGAIAFTNLGGETRLVKLPHYSKDVRIMGSLLNAVIKPQLPQNYTVQGVDTPNTNEKDVRSQLEQIWNLPPPEPLHQTPLSSTLSPEMFDFLRYCAGKNLIGQWIRVRYIRQHWANRSDVKGQALIDLLEKLSQANLGQWKDNTQRCWMPSFDPSALE